MNDKENNREVYIQGIQSLLENISDDDAKQLLFQLRDMVYANSDRTINELIADCNRRSDDWDIDERKIANKAFVEYRARVMMAMYYVQMFHVRKWSNKDDWNYKDMLYSDWRPYLGEVSEKLHLSEEEILCLACLYLNYFLPKAECDTGLDVEELKKREWTCPTSNYDVVGKEACFQISKVKDLAKIYMLQRFRAGMDQARVNRYNACDITNQLWRNILACEEMSKTKIDRMKNCPREHFAGSEIELRFSVCRSDYVDTRQETVRNVLKAYELLNQEKNYDEVMGNTRLSFKEVRIIDCFTLVKAKEEA